MSAKEAAGVFASALARITSRGSGSTHTQAHTPEMKQIRPGAVKQVRGATYPPMTTSTRAAPTDAAGPTTPTSASAAEAGATSEAAKSPVAAVAASLTSAHAAAGTSPAAVSAAAAESSASSGGGGAETGGDEGSSVCATNRKSPSELAGFLERAADPALTPMIRGSVRTLGRVWPDESAYVLPTRGPKFLRCLDARNVEMESLRQLAWSGVPNCYRTCTWQMLLGYLPPSRDRQASSLSKKKLEYQQYVSMYFGSARGAAKSEADQAVLRQVLVDVPRTLPEVPICRSDFVQRSLERVLYVWAMRHPASGYVQGINDIATPLYAVFLSPWADIDNKDLSHVDPTILLEIEADVYWCLTKLLDAIQDHFTPAQPGIQRMIYRLRELVHRIDETLVTHLESNGVEFFQFAFRWMNCLLIRELPFKLIIRLWDTCLAEQDGFDNFHTYVCAALLLKFAAQLKVMKFQELVTFMQKLPTKDWTVKDVEELLSQAYVYKTLFESAPRHLA